MLNSVLSEAEGAFVYDRREVHRKLGTVTLSEWCSVVRTVIVRPGALRSPGSAVGPAVFLLFEQPLRWSASQARTAAAEPSGRGRGVLQLMCLPGEIAAR